MSRMWSITGTDQPGPAIRAGLIRRRRCRHQQAQHSHTRHPRCPRLPMLRPPRQAVPRITALRTSLQLRQSRQPRRPPRRGSKQTAGAKARTHSRTICSRRGRKRLGGARNPSQTGPPPAAPIRQARTRLRQASLTDSEVARRVPLIPASRRWPERVGGHRSPAAVGRPRPPPILPAGQLSAKAPNPHQGQSRTGGERG